MIYLFEDIGWFAVLAGTVISYLIGWFWYSPLMYGKKWAEGLGVDMSGPPPVFALVLMVFAYLLLNVFINLLVVTEAIYYMAFAGGGFIVMGYSGETFAGHPRSVRLINAGCQVNILVLATTLQSFMDHVGIG